MNIENNLVNTLHDIKDRCFIYSIMLAESSSNLGKTKILFKLPAIFISIVLSVINSSKLNESEEISIINTVFNALIALMIGIENTLQLDNKRQVFITTKNKFEKLHSNIEKRLLDTSEVLSVEFVQNAISEFEQIDDDLTFDIPKPICDKTKANFMGKRTLPLILGGDKVAHNEEIQQDLGTKQIQVIKELQPILSETQSISQRHQLLSQQVQLSKQPHTSLLSQMPQISQISQLTQIPHLIKIPQLSQTSHQQQLTQIQELSQILQIPQKPLSELTQILETAEEKQNNIDAVIEDIPEYTNMSI